MKTREQFKRFKAEPGTGVINFLSDQRGVYIPRDWLAMIDPDYWDEVTPWARECLEAGPEHDHYWDAWEQVTDTQTIFDTNDNEWTMLQDGDLWIVCEELMTAEQREHFGYDPLDEEDDDDDDYDDYIADVGAGINRLV